MSEKLNMSVECSECAFCSDDGMSCTILNDVPIVCENYLDKDLKDSGLLDEKDIIGDNDGI